MEYILISTVFHGLYINSGHKRLKNSFKLKKNTQINKHTSEFAEKSSGF